MQNNSSNITNTAHTTSGASSNPNPDNVSSINNNTNNLPAHIAGAVNDYSRTFPNSSTTTLTRILTQPVSIPPAPPATRVTYLYYPSNYVSSYQHYPVIWSYKFDYSQNNNQNNNQK